jgi:aminoglycoside phosphotransferase (APT) family kinase protein
LIPQEKQEAVTRGLREAFGVDQYEDISVVTGGHTPSLVYRLTVNGSPYLLKIITRAEDPTRHYTSMKAAADAGVAPRVWFTDTAEKISITDFVPAQPLPVSEARLRLPALLRQLHTVPPFARAPFNTTCTYLLNKRLADDPFFQRFRAANLLPPGDAREWFARHAELAAIYPYDDAEMVASHNDLFKPDNILFTGDRLWLVDWEAAFLNDRYADLVAVANQIVTNTEEESGFLTRYFGAPPDPYQRARFYVMQQLSHLFYTMSFLFLGSAGKPIDWTVTVPTYDDFHRRRWAGEWDFTDNEVKVLYGKVHWERLLHNLSQPRYQESVKLLSQRHATA